eukprot:TRINITY_DN19236_c0_g1_i1.p1 TRINITY_DN19236_c0_g1~~TRINITY_DN19236_c0_g1_i1.p1  ORF type:complete len:1247 (+),score=182.65 TRINITY_DN19236_c0_g1_i1:70-3741(+)
MMKRKKKPKASSKRKKSSSTVLDPDAAGSRQCMLQFLQKGKRQSFIGPENVVLLCSDDEAEFQASEQSAKGTVPLVQSTVATKMPLSTTKSVSNLQRLLQDTSSAAESTHSNPSSKVTIKTLFQPVPRDHQTASAEVVETIPAVAMQPPVRRQAVFATPIGSTNSAVGTCRTNKVDIPMKASPGTTGVVSVESTACPQPTVGEGSVDGFRGLVSARVRRSRFSIIPDSEHTWKHDAVVAAALVCFVTSFHREVPGNENQNVIFHDKQSYHVAHFIAHEQPQHAVTFTFIDGGEPVVGKVVSVTQPDTLFITKLVFCGGWLNTEIDKGTPVNIIVHDVGCGPVPPMWGSFQDEHSQRVFALGVGPDDKVPVIAVTDPKLMITATDTSASVQCMRRAWLNSISKSSVGNASHAAVTGTVIHRVVQTLISEGSSTVPCNSDLIEHTMIHAINDPSLALELFSCREEDREKLISDLPRFSPSIQHCVDTLRGKVGIVENIKRGDEELSVTVTGVEKQVACDDHGLRGIMDVEGVLGGTSRSCALEIKTMQHLPKGRALLRPQHKAQLLVYLLLAKSSTNGPVLDGILAYLPKGTPTTRFTSISRKALWNELIHVVRLRNKLASYIKKSKAGPPPNYSNQNLCKWCSNAEACLALAEVNGMQAPVDLSKFEFIFGETPRAPTADPDSQDFPLERAGSARITKASIPNTMVAAGDESGWGVLRHQSNHLSYLKTWDRWISLELAASQTSKAILSRLRGNVVTLFMRPQYHRLRRLFIDLHPPEYTATTHYRPLEQSLLNNEQNTAVERILSAKDYHIVQGLPGTGKSFLIANLVGILVQQQRRGLRRQGAKILISSGTNSAIDTIAMKILEIGADVKLLRVASSMESVHTFVRPHVFNKSTYNGYKQIDALMETVDVVLCTSHSAHHPLVGASSRRYYFDVLIIDEASQLLQAAALGPMLCCSSDCRYVLVGDHQQLPPVVQSDIAKSEGCDVSFLQRLASAHPASVTALTKQFRMCSEILTLSNLIMYKGSLEPASERVARQRLEVTIPYGIDLRDTVMRYCLSSDPPVVFVDTSNINHSPNDIADIEDLGVHKRCANTNQAEADFALLLSNHFNSMGIESVGIITPFRPQLDLLRHINPTHPDIYSIDQSQGKDMDVVILTLAKKPGERVGGLVRDPRRLNVAFTRAKKKLICIGAFSAVFDYIEEWSEVLALVRQSHGIVSAHTLR